MNNISVYLIAQKKDTGHAKLIWKNPINQKWCCSEWVHKDLFRDREVLATHGEVGFVYGERDKEPSQIKFQNDSFQLQNNLVVLRFDNININSLNNNLKILPKAYLNSRLLWDCATYAAGLVYFSTNDQSQTENRLNWFFGDIHGVKWNNYKVIK